MLSKKVMCLVRDEGPTTYKTGRIWGHGLWDGASWQVVAEGESSDSHGVQETQAKPGMGQLDVYWIHPGGFNYSLICFFVKQI